LETNEERGGYKETVFSIKSIFYYGKACLEVFFSARPAFETARTGFIYATGHSMDALFLFVD
jgi:hypothetical protein